MLAQLRIWLNHFEYHSNHPRSLRAGPADALTREEKEAIAGSLATFQLGEQSAGSSLLGAAYRYARETGATEVARIFELLVREEQQHALILKDFMQAYDLPLKARDWTDTIFRQLRKGASLELYLHILLSAELIGNVYYRALEQATACQRLRLLCRVLVADELAHVGFESDLLLHMRAQRPGAARMMADLAHRAFFLGTAAMVWATHSRVLRRSGYGIGTFLQACRAQYAFYLEPPRVHEQTEPVADALSDGS